MDQNERRNKHNQELISRMKNGEQLQYDARLTWYPNRPTIKKDFEHVKQLYGEGVVVLGDKKMATLCALPECDKI